MASSKLFSLYPTIKLYFFVILLKFLTSTYYEKLKAIEITHIGGAPGTTMTDKSYGHILCLPQKFSFTSLYFLGTVLFTNVGYSIQLTFLKIFFIF